jgi:hypothetical protein
MGDLLFYGRDNAEARGEQYPYKRYTGVAEAQTDPFALFLDQNTVFRELYLAAEPETGYIRDQNVFGDPITIEDTMAVTARYCNGVLLSYCLIAYSTWEGMRVAITGTKGRIELTVTETPVHLAADAEDAKDSKGAFDRVELRVFPMFGTSYDVSVSAAEGGHGGADPVMLEQIFSPEPPADPLNRAASHVDGAVSVLTGFAANEAIRTNKQIAIDDLFPLPLPAAKDLSDHPGA